jgi:hypothetical protein
MPAAFIAVLRDHAPAAANEFEAAGALAVLSWAEIAAGLTDQGWDELPAVLVDVASDGIDPAALVAEAIAALSTLQAVDGGADSAHDLSAAVIATTRPMTDTLKLVAADGTLIATAEREDHRFVVTPIAARLRVLRLAAEDLPGAQASPIDVLGALADRGFTVVAT